MDELVRRIFQEQPPPSETPLAPPEEPLEYPPTLGERFEQGGLYGATLPYAAGIEEAIAGLIPQTAGQAAEGAMPPRITGGVDVDELNRLGAEWRGEYGPETQARSLTGTALQALPLLHLPYAESPLRASASDIQLAEAIRQLSQEPPPPVDQAAPPPAPQPQIITPPMGDPFHPPEIPPGDLPYTDQPATTTPSEAIDQGANIRPAPEGLPAGELGETGQQRTPEPVSTKNAYTEAQIQERGLAPAVQEARRDFGQVWDEAEATNQRDPGAGSRLVADINSGAVKALNDHDNALLLREQIGAQAEHTDAVNAVNESPTPQNKARLQMARDNLQAVYDADRKAGRATGQGLNARKMLAEYDYTLGRMEARQRAANNGKVSEGQLKETADLHARIDELSKRLDDFEKARASGASFSDVMRGSKQAAKSAAASGKGFVKFMEEHADQARKRLIEKRGRLNVGIDPTNVIDEAIIGASHIAKGLTKFADWSAQMVKEFGDRVKPYLKELWNRSTALYNAAAKAHMTPQEANLARYKTRMAGETVGVTGKIQRGDFTKTPRQKIALDNAAYKMRANLQRLKNEFERGVAKDAYNNMNPADKFWQHFVGIERAMKLSSPAVFEKLGLAALVREGLAPAEAAIGYGASKIFPKLTEGTRYGAGLGAITRSELKAKAAIFTQGMQDAWENLKGKETELEAMSDKYGRQPDFWYNRIGKVHAAIKAPIKRAEFVRSLETRMDAATRAGEDINQPQVMDRLAHESALDANRAIFQQNTVVSKFFSQLEKTSPAGGRAARFLFPVVKIPVNLFKELVTYHVGAPVAIARIGHAYWNGIETLEPAAREAIVRQLAKGSVGGAALLWGYYNSDKVDAFFKSVPTAFEHTPVAMAIHEGAIVRQLEQQGQGTRYRPTPAKKEATYLAKTAIPFAYTVTGAANALDPSNPYGWSDYIHNMISGTVVPQAATWTAKEMDKPTPFSPFQRTTTRYPRNIMESITQSIPGHGIPELGIPGREDIPPYVPKQR